MKRAIQQQLENPLAQDILAGHFLPGDVIEVESGDHGLIFSKSASVTGSATRDQIVEGELVD